MAVEQFMHHAMTNKWKVVLSETDRDNTVDAVHFLTRQPHATGIVGARMMVG
jgi:hypothetical protein